MTAELDRKHQEAGIYVFDQTGDLGLCITCTCGWMGPDHDMYKGLVSTSTLRDEHYDHLFSQPGYVQYYSRPSSFDDDEY